MRKGRFSQPAAELAQRYSESVSSIGDFIGKLVVHSIAKSVSLDQIGVPEIKRFFVTFR
jgi:hypothetical protein